MAAFRLHALRVQVLDKVLTRLAELDYIAPEEVEVVADGAEATLREQVHEDLLTADANGVCTEDGYFQFATYRFEFGDDWQQWPNVQAVFAEASGREDRFLDALYATLASPPSD